MNPVVQSLVLFVLAGVAFLFVGALTSAMIVRAGAERIASLEPGTRFRLLVLLACLPLVAASALLLSASLPSIVALAVPELDHCLTHDDRHAHLCFVHLPGLEANLPVVLGLTFLASYALMRLTLALARMVRATRVLRALTKTGLPRADLGATLLETPAPLCVTAGLLQPSVLISRGLFEVLSDDERAIVLGHEHEHARRKHALVASIVRMCSAVHLPAIRRWIVGETEIAAEQACDEEAGRVSGDRTAVAAAILTVERATQCTGMVGLGILAVGAGTCAVERRVRSLLADPQAGASLRPVYVALGLVLVAVLAAADPLHHGTEAFLSMLAH